MRRARRSHFSVDDERQLLEAISTARTWAIRCCAAVDPTSPRYQACVAVAERIDALAGDLTGDPEIFHAKQHG